MKVILQGEQRFWLAGCTKEEKEDMIDNFVECIEDDLREWWSVKSKSRKPFVVTIEIKEGPQ